MTLEMLQNSFKEARQGEVTPLAPPAASGDECQLNAGPSIVATTAQGLATLASSATSAASAAVERGSAAATIPQWMAARPGAAPAVVEDRLARLARRCLEGLGDARFQAARRAYRGYMDAAESPASVRRRMLELLGPDHIGFLSLLDQLVHMERTWGPGGDAVVEA